MSITDFVRREYPRPQLVRPEWLCLNGEWQFALDADRNGERRGWTGGRDLPERIVVPFCPESRLSGVGNTDFMECVWYRRAFAVPEAWRGRRVLLHFGAVDYLADVWVNGRHAGGHRGGYTPFALDVADLLRPGDNELVVRAIDETRSPLQPTGKQSMKRESYGCRYTRTTGIWQTVWLEPVPAAHVAGLRLTPVLDAGRLDVEVALAGPVQGMRLRAVATAAGEPGGEAEAPAANCVRFELPLRQVRAWSPADPFLYDLRVSLRRGEAEVDAVGSYFGMRDVRIDGPSVLLNGRSVFQRLVLDQGYYPDGIYTAPDDAALRRDIELAQALGFNGARLHEKVFEPRFLYWADRLGYLVWGEFPNWGLDHAAPEALGVVRPEWEEAVRRDINHPAIVGWCPFNETPKDQNPELIRAIFRLTKALDSSRPAIDTSGYTHVETEVYDSHNYEQDVDKFTAIYAPFAAGSPPFRNRPDLDARYGGQPYFVSEYGGIWWNPGQDDEQAWGYGNRPKSLEEFMLRYAGLTRFLLDHPRMFGFCYTQLYDVEQEVNGLYTYAREPKFDAAAIRAINTARAAMEV